MPVELNIAVLDVIITNLAIVCLSPTFEVIAMQDLNFSNIPKLQA